jgi:hypothetical protein
MQMEMPLVAEVIAEAANKAAEPTNPFPKNIPLSDGVLFEPITTLFVLL